MRNATPGTDTQALVDADWLTNHLSDPDIAVIEVDVSPAAHEAGHIPGATLWNIYTDLRTSDLRPRPLDELCDLVRSSGIDEATTVVFCGYAPALGYWLLTMLGHERVHILDCGRSAWQADGRPWTAEGSVPAVTDYHLVPTAPIRAGLGDVVALVVSEESTIADVRSHNEYVGERFWPSGGVPDGGRAGRIPNAVHVPADGIVGADGTFRPTGEIASILGAIPLDRPVVTYCTVGARAATVWFALTELMGHPDVKVYDGSWAEWGMAPDTPVAVG